MDKVANTVGHYDAYRKIKNIDDKFVYELINPENHRISFLFTEWMQIN